MSNNKKAYFQGTEKPTPKKKKYKSDPALLVQPRFEEPLFKNYDLYETPGKHSPGGGFYQNMDKYDSVNDFIQKKRKRNSGKYKANDSWIQDDGSLTKSPSKKRAQRRIDLLLALVKNSQDNNSIDFPIDDQVTPILGDAGSYGDSTSISVPLPLAEPDAEGKSSDQLNFGRDYVNQNKCGYCGEKKIDVTFPCETCGKGGAMAREPHGLYGIPNGVDSDAIDADATISNMGQDYGQTNSGNTLYGKV